MKKRLLTLFVMGVLTSLALTGCGDGSENMGRPAEPPTREAAAEPTQTPENENHQAISEYEQRYSAGEFTAEDYKALAGLYGQEGMVKRQRDMLEQCYRMFGDGDAFTSLREVAVNVAEEESRVQELTAQLRDNLSLPDYLNEGIGLLMSPEWFQTMNPSLKEGGRRYFLADAQSGEVWFLEVGYDGAGKAFSNVWRVKNDSEVLWIAQKEDSVQMMTAGLEDGQYQGAFDSWLCVASTGDVFHETGTFEGGVLTGAYTAQVKFGTEASDLFGLWSSREIMELKEYTGDFGAEGKTTLDQPAAKELKAVRGGTGEGNVIVYAYDSGKSNYLFVESADTEAADYVFHAASLGMESCPQFTQYEPVPQESGADAGAAANGSGVKVRIFDGKVEWNDGSGWHSAGSVEQLAQEDPFRAYQEGGAAAAGNGTEGGEGQSDGETGTEGQDGQENGGDGQNGTASAGRGGGTVVKPAQKPANKPANKPATSNPPAATPSTEPAPPAENGGGNSGGGDNGGSNGGGDNGGGGGGESTPPPSSPNVGGDDGDNGGAGGSDTDVEWTPDIL